MTEASFGGTVENAYTKYMLQVVDNVTVTANYAATFSTQTGVASGSMTVSNRYLYALPETGGVGTTRLYTLGGLLLVMTVIILCQRKRVSRPR
ncbi:MAG: LPXTG cell wall anchor domain-containing protein [Clostridiaceae bacterium]